jgi:hypothetical protein
MSGHRAPSDGCDAREGTAYGCSQESGSRHLDCEGRVGEPLGTVRFRRLTDSGRRSRSMIRTIEASQLNRRAVSGAITGPLDSSQRSWTLSPARLLTST